MSLRQLKLALDHEVQVLQWLALLADDLVANETSLLEIPRVRHQGGSLNLGKERNLSDQGHLFTNNIFVFRLDYFERAFV